MASLRSKLVSAWLSNWKKDLRLPCGEDADHSHGMTVKFIAIGATCDRNLHAHKIWQSGHGLFDKESYVHVCIKRKVCLTTMMLHLEILEILGQTQQR